MTRIKIRELVWDAYNTDHIKKHNVSQEEVVVVVKSPVYHKRAYSGRYMLVGRTGNRIISVLVRRQKVGVYYPVTARDSDKKERRRVYEKEKSK